MTNAELFAKLRSLIEDAKDADKKHIKKIRKVLRKLKDRQHKLRDCLGETDNAQDRLKMQQEIEIITLQRRKGAEVYKQLKLARKTAKQAKRGNKPHGDNPDAADLDR
jgi:hypothetical protein